MCTLNIMHAQRNSLCYLPCLPALLGDFDGSGPAAGAGSAGTCSTAPEQFAVSRRSPSLLIAASMLSPHVSRMSDKTCKKCVRSLASQIHTKEGTSWLFGMKVWYSMAAHFRYIQMQQGTSFM